VLNPASNGPPDSLLPNGGGFGWSNPIFSTFDPITMFTQRPDPEFNFDDLIAYKNSAITIIAKGGAPSGTSEEIPFSNLNAFQSMVTNPRGDMVIHASYNPLDPKWTFFNGTGIYSYQGDGLKLVFESGTPVSNEPFLGDFALTQIGNLPRLASVSSAGRIVFNANSMLTNQVAILEASIEGGEVRAVIVGGRTFTTIEDEEVSLEGVLSRPVVNKLGDIYFRAREPQFIDSLWRFSSDRLKRLVKTGGVAPGTDGATLASIGHWVVNAKGQVAMLGTLELGGVPLVTPDNNFGLWLLDEEGNWGLIARTGSELIINESNYGTIKELSFETNGNEGTGNDEGIMSGLSDIGEVVFLAELTGGIVEGQKAIVRSKLVRASGDDYFWNGAAGNNLWYGKNGDTSNWEDNQDLNWVNPPGGRETENVKVTFADVVLETKSASIAKIESGGSLTLKQDLHLSDYSSIDSLDLTNGAEIVLQNNTLTLTGPNNKFSDGVIKRIAPHNSQLILDPNSVLKVQSTGSETVTIEPLTINKGTMKLFSNLQLKAGLENRLTIEQSGPTHISGGPLLLSTNSDLKQISGGSSVDSLDVDGGRVSLADSTSLNLENSRWKRPDSRGESTVYIGEAATLLLEGRAIGDDRNHKFGSGKFIIDGPGELMVIQSELGVLSGGAPVLDAANVRFEDSTLGYALSDDFLNLGGGADRKVQLSTKSHMGTRPAVLFRSTGNSRTTSILLESVVIDSYANAQFEGSIFVNDSDFVNYKEGKLLFNNASFNHISKIDSSIPVPQTTILTGNLNAVWNFGDLTFSGSDNELGANAALINFETVSVGLGSKLSFLSKRNFTDGVFGDGTWNVGGKVDIPKNIQITGIAKTARLNITGLGEFGDLPTKIPDGFVLKGILELNNVTNARVGGSILIKKKGKLILNDSNFVVDNFLILDDGSTFEGEIFFQGNILNGGELFPYSFFGFPPANENQMQVDSGESGDLISVASTGTATITGDYEQTTTGSIEIELAGYERETEFDFVDVTGNAVLDGALKVVLIDDFVPQAGDRFEVLNAGTISGTFSTVGMDPFREDLEFKIEYSDTAVTVEAVSKLKTYETWVADTFSADDQVNESISGQSANPDTDTWLNLLEYIFATDPNQITYGVLPISGSSEEAGKLDVSFPWANGISDATFELECSSDMEDWATTDAYTSSILSGETAGRINLELDTSSLPSDTKFYRLRFILE